LGLGTPSLLGPRILVALLQAWVPLSVLVCGLSQDKTSSGGQTQRYNHGHTFHFSLSGNAQHPF
jgi:hypothetical protein